MFGYVYLGSMWNFLWGGRRFNIVVVEEEEKEDER